jgi:hypothetical protein
MSGTPKISPAIDSKSPGGLPSASNTIENPKEIKNTGMVIFQNVLRFIRFSNEKSEGFSLLNPL